MSVKKKEEKKEGSETLQPDDHHSVLSQTNQVSTSPGRHLQTKLTDDHLAPRQTNYSRTLMGERLQGTAMTHMQQATNPRLATAQTTEVGPSTQVNFAYAGTPI